MATQNEITQVLKWLLKTPFPRSPDWNEMNKVEKGVYSKRYCQSLMDLDINILRSAAETWAASETWWPTPANLRQTAIRLIMASVDILNSAEAWREIRKERNRHLGLPKKYRGSPKFSQEVIGKIVEWIGWKSILYATDREIVFKEKKFCELYEIEVERLETILITPMSVQDGVLRAQERKGLPIRKIFAGYLEAGE